MIGQGGVGLVERSYVRVAVVAESGLILQHVKHGIEVGDFFLDGENGLGGDSRLLRKGRGKSYML